MIRTVGIIGSGKMGTDLFNYLSDFNFQLVWLILFEEEKEKHHKSFIKKISRQLKHDLINQEQFESKNNYILTNSLKDLADCDLIIESIFEDKEEKTKLFRDLQAIVKKDCLLASNSSSILPSGLSDLEPVIGMHFFYPVAFKNTVELVIHDKLSADSIELASSFLKLINKKILLQDKRSAFSLNRFLLAIQIKAFRLVGKHNISFAQIDGIARQVIPEFGLFEMMDQVGLQTMYNSIFNYAVMENAQDLYSPLLNELDLKIKLGLVFCTEQDENSVSDSLAAEIKDELLSEAINTFKKYNVAYSMDELIFSESLNDFLGIRL